MQHESPDRDAHHGHGHGNDQDQGWRAMVRYLRNARSMWHSDSNEATVARLAPQPGERVADIGAGVGAGTMLAARSGAHVVAVEPTPYMRRVLGWRRMAQRARARIEIVDGAAEATGVASSTIDGVWAVNTMHHWTDLDTAVGELARIMRPGSGALRLSSSRPRNQQADREDSPSVVKAGSVITRARLACSP